MSASSKKDSEKREVLNRELCEEAFLNRPRTDGLFISDALMSCELLGAGDWCAICDRAIGPTDRRSRIVVDQAYVAPLGRGNALTQGWTGMRVSVHVSCLGSLDGKGAATYPMPRAF